MENNHIATSKRSFRNSENWLRIFTYTLFIFSIFSITGADISVLLLYLTATFYCVYNPCEYKPPLWVVVPFVLYPCIAIISTLANPDPAANSMLLKGEFRIFLPLALAVSLRFVNLLKLLKVYTILVIVITLYGYIQFNWGVDWFRPESKRLIEPMIYPGDIIVFRAKGNFSVSLTFAGVMLVIAPILLSLYISEKNRSRYLWGAGAVMAGLGVLFSLARSGWFGAFAGVVILAFKLKKRWAIPLVLSITSFIAVLIILIYSGWVYRTFYKTDQPAIIQRFLYTTPRVEIARLYFWESGMLAVRDNFWLGVGTRQEDRLLPYMDIISKRHRNFNFPTGPTLHNIYLQIIFTMGLLGLIVYFSLWIVIFYWNFIWIRRAGNRFHTEKAILYGTSGGLFGSMVAGFFENNFLDGEVNIAIMIAMGLSLYCGAEIQRGLEEQKEEEVKTT